MHIGVVHKVFQGVIQRSIVVWVVFGILFARPRNGGELGSVGYQVDTDFLEEGVLLRIDLPAEHGRIGFLEHPGLGAAHHQGRIRAVIHLIVGIERVTQGDVESCMDAALIFQVDLNGVRFTATIFPQHGGADACDGLRSFAQEPGFGVQLMDTDFSDQSGRKVFVESPVDFLFSLVGWSCAFPAGFLVPLRTG